VCQGRAELEDPKDLRAEIGKAPNSTNERKKMSIKTLRKHIAVVAVSALTAGVFSVMSAPVANAVDANDLSLALDSSSVSESLGICASDNATTTLTTVAMQKAGSLKLTLDANNDNTDTVKVTGVLRISSSTLAGAISTDQTKFTADGGEDDITFTATGAGTAVIYTQDLGTGANNQTINVTVLDTCSGVNNPTANSYVQVVQTADRIQRAADSGTSSLTTISESSTTRTYTQGSSLVMNTNVDAQSTFANGATAHVNIMGRDAYKNILIGADYSYGLSCTGSITVNERDSNSGFIAGVASQYIAQFTVAQNTANAPVTTVCTASINNITVGTKTIVFTGDLAKIEAVMDTVGAQNVAANATGAGAIKVKLFDSAGNRLAYDQTGIGTIALTDTNSALVNAISIGTNTTTSVTGVVNYNCVGAGKSGAVPVVLKATNAAGATISANSVTANCGGALETFTASLDKAVYNTGEVATLTISGLDANGKMVNDTVAMTGAAISIGGMTAVVAPTTADTFSGGVKKYTYKVDTTTGNYVASVSVTSGSAQAAVTIPVTIKSSTVGTTNEDVLKSIVALIASINKQIQALQKLILKR
jgi:hypothetical protein